MRRRAHLYLPKRTSLLTIIAALLCSGSLACKSHTTELQKSQSRGDEASVISAMRTVTLAQQGHAVTNSGNYAGFVQLAEGGYLDSRFSSDAPKMNGYVLTMTLSDKSFSCNADPAASSDLKGRHFYVDSSSPLIRVNANQPASVNDEVLKF